MARHERDLRRAVSRLSECAIEDIEQIWSELSATNRNACGRCWPSRAASFRRQRPQRVPCRLARTPARRKSTLSKGNPRKIRRAKQRLLTAFIESAPPDLTARIQHGLRIKPGTRSAGDALQNSGKQFA